MTQEETLLILAPFWLSGCVFLGYGIGVLLSRLLPLVLFGKDRTSNT